MISALKTLREQRQLDLADVAAFVSIPEGRLQAFEGGERHPTRKQLSRLADAYGVPLYSLVSGSIPNVPEVPVDFRRPTPEAARVSVRGLKRLIAAQEASRFAFQLALELGFTPTRAYKNIAIDFNRPRATARNMRSAFDAWLVKKRPDLGLSGDNVRQFVLAFRLFFEAGGGVLNVQDAPSEDYFGFYLKPDGGFQTVFVNRSIMSRKAQLFTLVHEFAHSIFGKEGISNPFVISNDIERHCNIFAAEFLAPLDAFKAHVERLPSQIRSNSTDLIEAVSNTTLLSKQAAAIRLLEAGYLNRVELKSWKSRNDIYTLDEKHIERSADPIVAGGQPHAKRLSELGHLPVYLAAQAISEGLVDALDVQVNLGLSEGLQKKAFALAVRRFEAAS